MSSSFPVHLTPPNVRDVLGNWLSLSQDPIFQDVQLICRDGIVPWNKFLLAASSSWLSACFSALDPWQEGVLTIIIPEVSSATLRSVLKCTLDYAAREDILSVSEQQVIMLLGFAVNLEQTVLSLLSQRPGGTPPRVISLNDAAFEIDSVLNDFHIPGLDMRPDIDTLSMVSIDGATLFDREDNLISSPPSPYPILNSSFHNPLMAILEKNIIEDPKPKLIELGTKIIPRNIPNERKTFKCDQCQASFSRSMHLEQHKANHNKEEPLACDQCGKVFYHALSLKDHKRYHTDLQTIFECQSCHKKLKGKRALRNHEDRFHNRETCKFCGKQFSKKSIKEHLRTEHQDCGAKAKGSAYKCELCTKSFSSSRSLMLHKRGHESQNDPKTQLNYLRCEQCGRLFACQEHLDHHMKRKHSESECHDCGKQFKDLSKPRHREHVIAKGTVKKTRATKCLDCDHVSESAHLKQLRHSPAPTSELETKTCNQCGKSRHNPKQHICGTHSENRLECQDCGQFFPDHHSHNYHVKNVHHPQNHSCPYCEMKVAHLSEHLCSSHGVASVETGGDMAAGKKTAASNNTSLEFMIWAEGDSGTVEEEVVAFDSVSGQQSSLLEICPKQ